MLRILQVGVGGYGTSWLDTVVAARDHVTYAGLVDLDDAALKAAAIKTGTPSEH